MGWCSGTAIFDGVMDVVLPVVEPEKIPGIVKQVAELLWDGDWDCEGDSKYYRELLYPLMLERGYLDEDDEDD